MKTYRPILFVLLFALGGVAFFIWSSWQDRLRAQDTQRWLTHTKDVIKELDDIQALVIAEESAARGYAITGDSTFIAGFPERNKTIFAALNIVTGLMADASLQATRLERLQRHIDEKLDYQRQIINARKTSYPEALRIISTLKGKKLMDSIAAELAIIKADENKLLKARTIQNQAAGRKSLQTAISGALIVLVFIGILLFRLNRDILLRRKAEEDLRKSETQYRQFVENAGVITYTSDINGNFTFISKQVEALTGYAPEELLGKHFTVLIPKEWIPIVAEKYYEQFKTRTRETNLVFPVMYKNGDIRWVEQDAVMIEKDGRVQSFQCVVKDVTEQTLVEQKLQKIEAEQKEYQYRIQAILDNAPLIIYIKDLEGRYQLVNRQFREIFGVTDEMVIGKTVYDIQERKTSSEKYTDADKQVIETRKPVELEDVLHLPDGDHHLLTIKFPLFDKDNQLLGVSGFMKDITEMVKSREEMIAARQKAESAETLQEQFLANMSHEIRTPMNGIIGMTSLLMHTPLQQQQQEYVQMIKQSSDNLLVLINDILDLSKIKAGKISIEKIAFSLEEVMKPLNSAFGIKAAEKELGYSTLVHPDVPPYLVGDPHRLSQVLNNLLSNAIKFTEKGYVTMEINVQEQNDKQVTLIIQVSDSGIGIDEKQIALIFESFAQASSDTTRRFGGTGLGLAITKRLVDMQHGNVHVASKPGAGTTFTILLPYGISSAQEVVKGNIKSGMQPDILENYSGKHVLIVEDNEVNQRVLQYNLEQYNLSVTVMGNGKEAVRWLEKNTTDLIMMDLHMPLMDGFQATDYIRRQLKLTVPVVVLTASVLRNERQRCFNIGANDYIAKPFAQEELRRCLERFLLHREDDTVDHEPVEASIADNPVFDLSALLQLKDPKAIREIYRVFEITVPPGLEELKQLAIREDWTAVFALAHRLKSSLGIIQVKDLLGKMTAIEMNARTHKQLRDILPMINESIAAYYHVAPMIKMEIEKETV